MADKPVTREEKYLAYLTGDYTGEIPKPITRKEKYLYELCLKGIGGEISPEEIKNAVNEYLEKNPVKPGATTEQAQQIEQNKTDIASLKVETGSLKEDKADKTALVKTDRKLDALWKLNQGISYEFQTDDTEAYQKTVPSGAKMASVKSIGGRTIVWNQLVGPVVAKTENGLTVTVDEKTSKFTIDGTSTGYTFIGDAIDKKYVGHKVLFRLGTAIPGTNTYATIEIAKGDSLYMRGNDAIHGKIIEIADANKSNVPWYIYVCETGITFDSITYTPQIFDLTQMFGAGNEPSTTEEFEAMFPADYYPYNAGELMSAPVNEVRYLDTKSQETSYPIPQAILNLPGYGWSAGDVRNEVNWENKQYVQRVDKVDLGTLNWTESGDTQHDGNSTYKSDSLNTVIRRYSTYSGNSICEKFNIVKVNDINRNEYEYSIGNSEMAYPLQFTVKQTFCTDENDFKNKINGIMLYYELAEPIVTDISDIIGNTFQEPLEVEAGGILTFKNSNGDNYRIPVSSTEEYLVSLAEVAK